MAEILGAKDALEVKARVDSLIYHNWELHFKKIRLFPGVKETLEGFKEAAIKLAMLSDFPPQRKLAFLGLGNMWDAVLCSETVARLKPDPAPFAALADCMGLAPQNILYVGNSAAYDIAGAKNAGMKAALIASCAQKLRYKGNADFVFRTYRQLYQYVIG